MRTIKDFAIKAHLVMTVIPCNVSGVVFTFSEWMRFCCDNNMDQQTRNNHAITKAFLIGLNSMFGIDDNYIATIESIEELIK